MTGHDPPAAPPAVGRGVSLHDDAPPLGLVLGPLPVWAVTAVGGGLAGEWLADGQPTRPSAAALAAVVVLASGAVAALALARGRNRPGLRWALLSVFAVATVMCAAAMLRIDTTARGLLPVIAAQGGSVELEATVVHEPRPIATGWHVVVRVDVVDGIPTRERAAVTLDGDVAPPLGSRWFARTTARPLPEDGYGRWVARQHAAVILDPETWEAAGGAGRLAAASEQVRDRVRRASTRHLDVRAGGLVIGFVTGDTRLLPDEDRDAMRATGLTHLTAVSGSNTAIVIGGVLGLCVLVRLGARGRRRSVVAVVAWFAFVTRFEPSVLRAGTMAALLLLASARGVARDARHALAGAVLLLVLVDPRLAGSLGLLLSATATAGVLVVAPLVRDRLPARLPRRVAELSSITIGAQVAVVPILLVTFGEVSLASIPANLVAVPAAGIAATVGFVGSVAALVHIEVGALVFAVAGPPTRVVLWSAHTFQHVGGVAEVARPATVMALLAACVWVLVRRESRTSRSLALVAAGLAVVAAVPSVAGRLPPSGFTITAIDVGQGDAFLVETPQARILVDAGGDDTAARWLAANGRRRLDLVVGTHPHLDHVGGIPDVLRRTAVEVVWFNPVPNRLPQAAEIIDVARDGGIPVRAPTAGDRVVVGDVVIEVVHPPPGRPYQWARSELNETSYVLRIHHRGSRVLTTGDVELAAQADLVAAGSSVLEAEVVTVPHHGAATTDPSFLAAVGARAAVIGVGAANPHGHPSPSTLAILETLGTDIRRTDVHGTVRVAIPAPQARGPAPGARTGLPGHDGTKDPPSGLAAVQWSNLGGRWPSREVRRWATRIECVTARNASRFGPRRRSGRPSVSTSRKSSRAASARSA